MTMHYALNHKNNVDRWYESRIEGRKGLQDSVDALIKRREDCIKKSVQED